MNDHIREGELLRAVDGELSKDRAAQINEHLAACWMCRTRRTCEMSAKGFAGPNGLTGQLPSGARWRRARNWGVDDKTP